MTGPGATSTLDGPSDMPGPATAGDAPVPFDPRAGEAAPFSGQSLRRVEDHRFLTGAGRYIEDIDRPGQAWAHVVRSPHAHARLLAIDTAAARAVPGVLGVFTSADLLADGLGPLPCVAQLPTIGPLLVPPRHALASDRVRHVGEPVALVVAETRTAARDAAELVEATYEALPCVVDPLAALAPGAPPLWTEVPGNQAFLYEKGDHAAVSVALAAAAHVVTLTLVNNRVIVAPMETRGAIATHDPATGGFELLLSGQGVHALRDQLAAVLGVPAGQVRVSCPDVGGGFGVKNCLYPEDVLLPFAARRLGRPVKWIADRSEDFLATVHGRDNVTTGRLALDAEGRFLALLAETVANLGACLSSTGPGASTTAPGNAMGGGYAIPAVAMRVRGALTSTVPIDAYRGAGKPEANYLVERLIDLAAPALGLDPIELRRRNLVSRFPHRTAVATTIDGGRFAAGLDVALAAAGHAGHPARREQARARGRLSGIALTCFLETARGAPDEGAEIRFEPDDSVTLRLGTQSNGQGHETSFAQVAADLLGLPPACFRLVQADTREVRAGHGHGGARSLHQGGAALAAAAGLVLERARPVAARLLQAAPDELAYAAGRFVAGGRSVGLLEVARAAREPGSLEAVRHAPPSAPHERAAPGATGLDSYVWNPLDRITFPNGCHVAEVEVDAETGLVALVRYTAVDDYGRVVNPLLTLGQVAGGLAQGIGQALLEHTVYDPQGGQLLSGSFMDYAVPRAADLPGFDIRLDGVATDANPLGVKGAGQAGCIAAPQAVVAAVMDALGVAHLDMPLTPERVWRALKGR